MDTTVQIQNTVLLHQTVIFTFPVMSQEGGKEQQEVRFKFLAYLNVVNQLTWIFKSFSM